MSEWMGEWSGVDGYPLDSYDYKSTYGAKKIIMYGHDRLCPKSFGRLSEFFIPFLNKEYYERCPV